MDSVRQTATTLMTGLSVADELDEVDKYGLDKLGLLVYKSLIEKFIPAHFYS